MSNLELKHIVGYLPYGLKGNYLLSDIVPITKHELRSKELRIGNIEFFLKYAKPILRPLSDLAKEIEVNGEKFVPMEFLNNRCLGLTKYNLENVLGKDYLLATYRDNYNCLNDKTAKDFLHEWHFDIHGLIEKGLAIDKNTIS